VKHLLVIAMGIFMAQATVAQVHKLDRETITLSQTAFTVTQGETRSVRLPQNLYIHKLFIQAESANRYDSYAEVSVNGDIKGTLYTPGRDPHYVVTVAERTSSIELHTINNALRIISIKAVVSTTPNDGRSRLPRPGYDSEIARLAYDIIQVVNALEAYTSYQDYGTYLLPIRKVAAKALAVADARGDASAGSRVYYTDLLGALDTAQPYLNRVLEYDASYELSIELMSITEQLRRILL